MFSLSPAFELASGRAMIFTANSSPDFLSVANLTTAKPAGRIAFVCLHEGSSLCQHRSAANSCNLCRICRLPSACIACAKAHHSTQGGPDGNSSVQGMQQQCSCRHSPSDEIKSQVQRLRVLLSCCKLCQVHSLGSPPVPNVLPNL